MAHVIGRKHDLLLYLKRVIYPKRWEIWRLYSPRFNIAQNPREWYITRSGRELKSWNPKWDVDPRRSTLPLSYMFDALRRCFSEYFYYGTFTVWALSIHMWGSELLFILSLWDSTVHSQFFCLCTQITSRIFCVNYTLGLQNRHLLIHKRIQSFVKQIGWLLTSTSTRITWLVNINLKRAKEKSTGSTINQGEDFSGERHQYFVSVVFVVKCSM